MEHRQDGNWVIGGRLHGMEEEGMNERGWGKVSME